ncbi:MAG: GNAT family N-acetyltransferase [Roseomonas sp.]|nr:GNAT family N-acetyltransferase [Roseomonas sp.]MCA3297718.1 GNAT family N-acetyltransferase [Roseomonas sp.]
MPPAPLTFKTLSGAALTARLDALAGLRIRVFREWPYLYDGDPTYEARYLAAYAQSPGALVVAASTPQGEAVGMATCQPGREACEKLRASWAAAGLDAATLCYFGESVLLPEYRGQGAGVRFFQEREAHARHLGLSIAAFCSVVRNENDPRRPRDYTPLDDFWHNRGYGPRPDISTVMHWREVGDTRETPHVLSFWIKNLS